MYKKIDQLISGALSAEEQDLVWEAMMKEPELFGYYHAQIGVNAILQQDKVLRNESPSFQVKWVFAAAAVLLLLVSSYLFVLENEQSKQLKQYLSFNPYDIESVENYRSDTLNQSEISTQASKAVYSILNADYKSAISIYNTLLVNEEVIANPNLHAKLLYNRSLANYALEDFSSSEADLLNAERISTDDVITSKIICARVKTLVADDRLSEAQDIANDCLESSLLTENQKRFIKNLIYS
jgi:hypothetical protein